MVLKFFGMLATFVAVSSASLIPGCFNSTNLVNHVLPKTTFCGADNRMYSLSYNVTTIDDSNFYDLDGGDFHDLEDVTDCNNDQSKIKLIFHDEINALKYTEALKSNAFITGGKKWNCATVNPKNISGVLVRRVVDTKQDGQAVSLRTALTRYDEIYQQGDIRYASSGACNGNGKFDRIMTPEEVASIQHSRLLRQKSNFDKRVCIGFNTNCKDGATQPLPLYSNQYLDITCSDCFLGYDTDVVLELKIDDWELKKLKAGYQNMSMDGALVITATAHADWSSGVSKVLELVNGASLIDFKVGPVPFRMTLDIPVNINLDISFSAQATAIFGATSQWQIGDHYVSWDPDNHWQHVKPNPTLIFKSVVRNASASFDATATFSVAPSIAMHIDSVFTYRATFTPTLTGEVKGDTTSKEICADLTYDLQLAAETEMDIAIPVLNIHDDWIWNKQIYDSGVKQIAKACTGNSSSTDKRIVAN